jgi:hypothetical protein
MVALAQAVEDLHQQVMVLPTPEVVEAAETAVAT